MVIRELTQFFLLSLPQVEVEVHVKGEALEQVVLVVEELMIQTELQVQLTKVLLEQMAVVVVQITVVEVEVELVKLETPTELAKEEMV
tara:strand:- start:290 stop:553 length:264 start_codon:yes stop_codon:yes gene_type:complete